jgi:hypothetical protein
MLNNKGITLNLIASHLHSALAKINISLNP